MVLYVVRRGFAWAFRCGGAPKSRCTIEGYFYYFTIEGLHQSGPHQLAGGVPGGPDSSLGGPSPSELGVSGNVYWLRPGDPGP